MDALQANHDERPANPCGRAHPFSSVHPYGPPCESRAKAPGPSCLCSIAQALTAAANRGKQWQGQIVVAFALLTGDWQSLLIIPPKTVLKLIFLSASIALSAFAPTAVEAASSCGIASYYGPGFHGRTTANGERFDSQALTFAHRSLPFGTKVKVTNQDNGRSIIVRGNDRGPVLWQSHH
jgi:rare lipoprotein A